MSNDLVHRMARQYIIVLSLALADKDFQPRRVFVHKALGAPYLTSYDRLILTRLNILAKDGHNSYQKVKYNSKNLKTVDSTFHFLYNLH